MSNDFTRLLEAHRRLDFECRNQGNRMFVGDWYCEHPFVRDVLPDRVFRRIEDDDLLAYYFENDREDLHDAIAAFHDQRDGVAYTAGEIFVGSGMTPLLTAQMMLLAGRGVRRLYYIRPLYYAYYYLSDLLGIELVPINYNPLHKVEEELALPREDNAWLLVCDPIWYIGRPIADEYIDEIRDWQVRWGSHVVVDGAFQYMRWGASSDHEATARLDRDLTLRAICPTKAVALHAIRFSYCLVPEALREEFRYAYANSSGSGCIFDLRAAASIMRYLNSAESNASLLAYIRGRYQYLVANDLIRDPFPAIMTYFCFVEPALSAERLIVMDQTFFDTRCYPGLTRFNLLLPGDRFSAYVEAAQVERV